MLSPERVHQPRWEVFHFPREPVSLMQIHQAVLVKFRIQNAVKITSEDVIGMIVEIRSKDSLYGVTLRSLGPHAHRGGVN